MQFLKGPHDSLEMWDVDENTLSEKYVFDWVHKPTGNFVFLNSIIIWFASDKKKIRSDFLMKYVKFDVPGEYETFISTVVQTFTRHLVNLDRDSLPEEWPHINDQWVPANYSVLMKLTQPSRSR